ncbi:MAG: DUF1232 domain-containing protein [Anaerolineae bacterium]|nr:DUF1232 domain-containing protein [Anaerolineae bacterium]
MTHDDYEYEYDDEYDDYQDEYNYDNRRALVRRDEGQLARRTIDWGTRGSIIAIIILTAIYVLSPVDFVPDLIPVAGQADDLAAIIAGGGSVTFLAVARYLLQGAMSSRVGRWGCLIMLGMMAIGACTVFYALLQLFNSVF